MKKEIIEGQQGFVSDDKKPLKEEIITKEETMFKVGEDGVAIPEKYPIYIYDHNIDRELIEEGLILMETIKRSDAINNVIKELTEQQNKEISDLKAKIEKETDEKKKKDYLITLKTKENTQGIEEIKTKINAQVVEKGIEESREILKELNKEKEKQKVKKFIELSPCNTSESYLAFEKLKTVDGKETTDWVADLISKKCFNPKYTLGEAVKLKPDYKIAIKKAIMEVSGYKIENYRDIISKKMMEKNRPLTIKKGKSTGETITPAESAS